MNRYVKSFLQRGALFGGLGPIIAGIVYACISFSVEDFTLSGVEVLLAIVTTYLLAFVQAGASVFNQIEHWPVAKSLLVHLVTIYLAYVGCYVVNFWIPFEWAVIGIFTGIFLAVYFVIWFSVYAAVKATSKRFNAQIGK